MWQSHGGRTDWVFYITVSMILVFTFSIEVNVARIVTITQILSASEKNRNFNGLLFPQPFM